MGEIVPKDRVRRLSPTSRHARPRAGHPRIVDRRVKPDDDGWMERALKAAKDNSGAAAVEFALIAPMMLLMVIGITELGKIVYYRSVLESAARSGTQAGIASTVSYTTAANVTAASATMVTATTAAITAANIGGANTPTAPVTCECSDGTSVTCVTGTCATGAVRYIATVTVTKTYTPLYNLTNLPGGYSIDLNLTLTGNAVMWVK